MDCSSHFSFPHRAAQCDTKDHCYRCVRWYRRTDTHYSDHHYLPRHTPVAIALFSYAHYLKLLLYSFVSSVFTRPLLAHKEIVVGDHVPLVTVRYTEQAQGTTIVDIVVVKYM